MKKLLFTYLGEIFTRFQDFGLYVWYISLMVCTLSLASVVGVDQPTYYFTAISIYQISLKVFIYSSLLYLLPTKEFMRSYVGISLMDDTVRTGLLYKLSKSVKQVTNGKLSPRNLYSKYLKKEYLKWVYIVLYLWDLKKLSTQIKVLTYVGYGALVFVLTNFLLSFITKPFYFDAAIHDIAIGTLIFLASTVIKIMFIPSMDTLRDMLVVYIVNKVNQVEARDVKE